MSITSPSAEADSPSKEGKSQRKNPRSITRGASQSLYV